MHFSRRYAVFALMVCSLFLFAPRAQAYTSTDYYNAGLQLYNAQNYAQAAQYFSAAIQVDPNNAAALQGRANCYYAQGQYQQALDDYQRVEALNPNPQLASMIQALQAKVGAGSPAAPPPQPGAAAPPPQPSTGDSFAQGTALFQQRQYAQAIPFFQKAVQDNPQNANAYYYLGACQMQAGNMKDAAVALAISNKLSPNASVENYVNQIKARLSPDDQQWVDNQVASASTGAATAKTEYPPKKYGIRFQPSIALASLSDFNANAQYWSSEAATVQVSAPDPSLTYAGSVPSGFPQIQFEPVMRLMPNLEAGLPIAFMPVGTVSDNLHDGNGVTVVDSFDITAFSVGLDLRYLFGQGDMQPYICGGFMAVPININYSAAATQASTELYNITGDFSGVAVGGQVSAGLDWHLGDTFVVSPFAGYQLASANSFQAQVKSGPVSTSSGAVTTGETAQLEVVPTSVGNVVVPVANGQLMVPVLNGTQGSYSFGENAPAGSRPLAIDLSGFFFGIGVSAFF